MKKTIATFYTVLGIVILISCTSCQSSRQTKLDQAFIPDSVYASKGDQLIAKTFDTLRNSLINAIRERGMEEAISFCSEKAFVITSTYADSVNIKRIALRYRNMANRPDSIEELVLKVMESTKQTGEMPASKIIRTQATGEVHYFKPILLQPMCLNCHGTPGKEIKESTLSKIQSIYPNDSAVNFKVADLRGAWHVSFKHKPGAN